MVPILALIVSIIAIVFSAIALSVTYRKEAHRIRLELHFVKYGGVVLGVNNDSGIDTSIRSVGYFRNGSEITWIADTVGDHVLNKSVDLPLAVKARSLYQIYLNLSSSISKLNGQLGMCVQLDTGRLYVVTKGMARRASFKLHLASWISRITGGRYFPGASPPRVKLYS